MSEEASVPEQQSGMNAPHVDEPNDSWEALYKKYPGAPPIHPLAKVFPRISEHEFKALVNDIKQNGLRLRILRTGDYIMDGVTRYFACLEAGVEPLFEEWNGKGSELEAVISLNVSRRHLSEGQRAMVAARIAEYRESKAGESTHEDCANLRSSVSTTAAAKRLRVSRRSVVHAKKVLKNGIPQLKAAVDNDELAVSKAAEVAKLAPAEQEAALAEGSKNAANAAKDITQLCMPQQSPVAFETAIASEATAPDTVESATASQTSPDLPLTTVPFEQYVILCLHKIEVRAEVEREPLKKELHSLWVAAGWSNHRAEECIGVLDKSRALYAFMKKALRQQLKKADEYVKYMSAQIEKIEAGLIPLLDISDKPETPPSLEEPQRGGAT